MEAFEKIDKELKEKEEYIEVLREIYFYRMFESMKKDGVSVSDIQEMIKTDKECFDESEMCRAFINSAPKLVKKYLLANTYDEADVICFMNDENNQNQSVIKSKQDYKTANKALKYVVEGEKNCYSETSKQIDEFISILEHGVSFDDLKEMIKMDVNLFCENQNNDDDEQTFVKSFGEAKRKVLALSILKNEIKRND